MPRIVNINHVALVVDDLQEAIEFYEQEMGLERLPAFEFDYPAQFFKINETQQLHLTEWKDKPSYRGHWCVEVDDFNALFWRMKELGKIDVEPWGKVRRLPSGGMQMFIRDPSDNLIEACCRPEFEVDDRIFDDDLAEREAGLFVSGRDDARGDQSADASLFHDDS